MFYNKYLTMYKVHMHAGAIRKLLCSGDNPLAKARVVDYLPVHTHKPYTNLHLKYT